MRILVGTFEICRHVYDLADGFRQAGHDADAVIAYKSPYHPDLPYDVEYNPQGALQGLAALQKDPIRHFLNPAKPLADFRQMLHDYDVFVFVFAHSLLPGNQDFPMLKAFGKQIICIFEGSDVRHYSAAEPVAEAFGYQIPPMYREAPYDQLAARWQNMRMAEVYADAIFSLPFQSELALRPYWHFYLPVNLDLYHHHIPGREVPRLVHAPSRRGFKGTDQFFAVLDRLEAEGVKFDLQLLEKVTNAEVIAAIEDADVVLDELNAPHYGMLALEGMATGCAVVAGCDLGYVPYQEGSPVYAVRHDTLYGRLKALLTSRDLRIQHAKRGRPFVEAKHRHADVTQCMLDKLGRTSDFDYYPTFAAEQYELPEGETLSEALRRLTSTVVAKHGAPAAHVSARLVQQGLADPCLLRTSVSVWDQPEEIEQQIWGFRPVLREVVAQAA
ncbi:MAG: hypothetical protein RhofKO_22600 [Rhodothermales bacterium]